MIAKAKTPRARAAAPDSAAAPDGQAPFTLSPGRTVTVKDFSDEMVCGFMEWALRMGRSPATVNKYRGHLTALWNFAKRRKVLDTSPDVDRIRGYEREPEAWSTEELDRLLRTAAGLGGFVGAVPAKVWWPALLSTMLDTGLRISPAMKLDRRDLDLAEGWVHVRAEIQKDRADQRLKLHASTLELLRVLWGPEPGRLFPWPYDPGQRNWKTLHVHYHKLLIRAGLPSTSRDKFHKVRRTTATNIADQLGAAAAQAYLGHCAMSVTKRYLDKSKIRGVQPADILPRPWLDPAVISQEMPRPAAFTEGLGSPATGLALSAEKGNPSNE